MKKLWEKILAAICAASLFITMPGMAVMAETVRELPVTDSVSVIEEYYEMDTGEGIPTQTGVEDFEGRSDAVIEEEAVVVSEDGDVRAGDVEVQADPGFEVYNADLRIKGFGASDIPLYDLLMNTHTIYQQLAEYAMEEKALYYSSGLWVSFFDDIFAAHPKYLYETILMAYLNFDANTAEVENTAKQAALEFSVDLASFVLSQGSEAIADKTDAWNQYLKETSVGDASSMMLNAGMVTDLGDIFDTVVNFSETAEELLDNLSSIAAVDKKRKQQVAFLEELKARTSDNQYLQEAIGEIVDIYKDADVVSLVKQSGRQIGYMAIKELPGAIWDALEKKIEKLEFAKDLLGIMSPVIEGAQLGASGLNMLFGSKTLSKDLMAILTLYIIDSEFRNSLRSLRQSFLNNPTKENAVRFNGAFNSYLEYQMYASQVAKQYIHDIINSGLLTKTFTQLFYSQNLQTAEDLTEFCDSQISSRKKIAEFESGYYDLYCGKYGFDKYVKIVSTKPSTPPVPVTGISFAQTERTIYLDSRDIYLCDVVFTPENATNKNYSVTSSDKSIVSADGVLNLLSPWKEGTVTITATSEDGGFEATQTVTVVKSQDGVDWSEGYPYKVGDHVWAKIVDTEEGKTLFFYSKGGVLNPGWQRVIGEETLENVEIIRFSPGSWKMYFPEDSSELFRGDHLKNLRTIDLEKADTSKVTNMCKMFWRCSGLTSLDVSGFNTSKVTNMRWMFCGCSGLTNLDVSGLDTSRATNVDSMFEGCSGLTSLDVSGFDTSSATAFIGMFSGCSGLTSLDVSGFNTSNALGMDDMFHGCSGLTSLDVSGFDTSSLTNNEGMFWGCSGLTSLDVSGFDVSHIKYMGGMFKGCSGLTSLDVSGFDTSNATTMEQMFSGCSGLTSLDVSGFNTSRVTRIYSMFEGCSGLKNIDLSGFDTSKVTDSDGMERMFYGCSGLTGIDVSSFNTSCVKSMNGMFSRCTGLTFMDVSGFDMSAVKDVNGMFYQCSNLETIKTPNLENSSCSPPSLPFAMYDASGKEYQSMPGVSMTLTRANPFPTPTGTPTPTPTPEPTLSPRLPQEASAYPATDELGIGLQTWIIAEGIGRKTYTSSNPEIISVSGNWISAEKEGEATITVTFAGDETYLPASVSFVVKAVSVWVVDSDSCGENAIWEYYTDGTVRVTGQGALELVRRSNGSYNWDEYFKEPSGWDTSRKPVKRVIVEEGITTIPESMFAVSGKGAGTQRFHGSPESVSLSDTVQSIGKCAFYNCEALTEVEIGAGLASLGNYSFTYCPKLEKILVSNNNETFASVDGALYSKDMTVLYRVPSASGAERYEIPEGVVTLAPDCLGDIPTLKEITIPHSVTKISKEAFDGSNALQKIWYEGYRYEWDAIVKASGAETLSDADIHSSKGKTSPVISFGSEIVEKIIGEKDFNNDLSTTSDGKVTYFSSDEKVAVIDPLDGWVTIKGTGETVITIETTESEAYLPGKAAYIVRVVSNPTITPTPTSKITPTPIWRPTIPPDQDVTKYSYEVEPILSPFCYCIYVKTDNPDPTSFCLWDKESVYWSHDGYYGFDPLSVWAVCDEDGKIPNYLDVVYEDASIGRVKGGYIFEAPQCLPDGGELVVRQRVVRRQSIDWQKDFADTDVVVTCPRLMTAKDYLIEKYTEKEKHVFENLKAVQSALNVYAVYPMGVRDMDKPNLERPYPFLTCSAYQELELNDWYSYMFEGGRLLMSAVYPFIMDSLGFPGTMASVAKTLNPSCEVSSGGVHWNIAVTYHGVTRYFGGAGQRSHSGVIYSKRIPKGFTFDGTEDDWFTSGTLEFYCDQLFSFAEASDTDAEEYRDLIVGTTFQTAIRSTGGTWIRVGQEGWSFDTDRSYAYEIPTRNGTRTVSDAWVDGRYVGAWEHYVPGVHLSDYPNAGIVVTKMRYTDVDGEEQIQDVLFDYIESEDIWRASGDDYYGSYNNVPEEFTLTRAQVEAMGVDIRTDEIPENGLIYDGYYFPGTPFSGLEPTPTNTPTPTMTPTPTNTPMPTMTPTPTNTPMPTMTPTPTNTPTSKPAETPTPSPIPERIDVGETKPVYMNMSEIRPEKCFAFTPPKTGRYTLVSSNCGGYDPYVEIFDTDDMEEALAENDDGDEGHNFSLSCRLAAGKTYVIRTIILDSPGGEEGIFSRAFDLTLVREIEAESVLLDVPVLVLKPGETYPLNATVLPAEAVDRKVTWKSGAAKVATVSADGLVTAVSAGTATIRAQTANGVKAFCKVTVEMDQVTKVTLNKTSVSTNVGLTAQLSTIVFPANAADSSLTWASSNAKVAVVSQSGLVTAVRCGTAKITATAKSGVKATCTVTVRQKYVYQAEKGGIYRYTTSTATVKQLIKQGWSYKKVFRAAGKSKAPVYWIYNKTTKRYQYTTDKSAAVAAKKKGHKAGLAFYGSEKKSIPVYELCKKGKRPTYFYTTSKAAVKSMKKSGWSYEGIAWYAELKTLE